MVDPEVFARRLGRLEGYLRELRALATVDLPTFQNDRGLQAQAERWTHLMVECCVDLANHLIADRGWETPDTYRESFRNLRRHDVLDADLADRMAGWAGLRNILVHLYLDFDHARLHEILTRDLGTIEAFARALRRSSPHVSRPRRLC